jgi:hypothetical protein
MTVTCAGGKRGMSDGGGQGAAGTKATSTSGGAVGTAARRPRPWTGLLGRWRGGRDLGPGCRGERARGKARVASGSAAVASDTAYYTRPRCDRGVLPCSANRSTALRDTEDDKWGPRVSDFLN